MKQLEGCGQITSLKKDMVGLKASASLSVSLTNEIHCTFVLHFASFSQPYRCFQNPQLPCSNRGVFWKIPVSWSYQYNKPSWRRRGSGNWPGDLSLHKGEEPASSMVLPECLVLTFFPPSCCPSVSVRCVCAAIAVFWTCHLTLLGDPRQSHGCVMKIKRISFSN